ncbi:hypothetical protein CCHL11_09965 [Colletotrichum chlorophyti]|uniref:Uncharacterized protein n=1 Tax=Colletotrichum chlorophyti TaxID=708187 RepID=A0A1Q8RB36_9PEZI|nr:hypothetical protein CCHL11_09965 [Colletotrichum chlorophyti]
MASGRASNSCFVISAPKNAVEGDTGGGTTVEDPAEDNVSLVCCIVGTSVVAGMVVAVVFLLPLLLLFSWFFPLLNVHPVSAVVPDVADSELVRERWRK